MIFFRLWIQKLKEQMSQNLDFWDYKSAFQQNKLKGDFCQANSIKAV